MHAWLCSKDTAYLTSGLPDGCAYPEGVGIHDIRSCPIHVVAGKEAQGVYDQAGIVVEANHQQGHQQAPSDIL